MYKCMALYLDLLSERIESGFDHGRLCLVDCTIPEVLLLLYRIYYFLEHNGMHEVVVY